MVTMMNTRFGSVSSHSMCPQCSNSVDEQGESIHCDRCGSWVHQTCTKIPIEALAYMESEGVFWFCQDCSKTMKKILKTKVTTEMEFKQEINNRLNEINAAVSELKAKSDTKILKPEKTLTENKYKSSFDNTSNEIRISGVKEFQGPTGEKAKFSDIVKFEQNETESILSYLGDDDYGITNIRRLGKYDSKSPRPRSLLISFNTPWTVRKILARANALRQYNLDNGTNIFISKSLNKDDQLKEKQCLSKRWQLITDEQYEKDKFKIINLKLFYDGKEIDTSK